MGVQQRNFRSEARRLKNGVGTGILVGLLTGNPLAGLTAGAVADGAEHIAAAEHVAAAEDNAGVYVGSVGERQVFYPRVLTDAGDKSYRNYYRNYRSDTNEARKLHGTNQDGTITPFWANFRDDGDRKLYFNRERTLTSAGGASETVQQRNFRSEARRLKNGVGTGILVGLLTGNPLAGLTAGAVAHGAEHIAAAEHVAAAEDNAGVYVGSDGERQVFYPRVLTDAGDKSYRNYYRNFRSDTNEARKLHGTNQDGTITPFWANFRDDGDRKLYFNRERTLTSA